MVFHKYLQWVQKSNVDERKEGEKEGGKAEREERWRTMKIKSKIFNEKGKCSMQVRSAKLQMEEKGVK